jgi:beta-glucanase (GH16 family)
MVLYCMLTIYTITINSLMNIKFKKIQMKKIILNKLILLLIIAILVNGCTVDDKQEIDQRNWELTWSDEFDGAAGALPDASKWAFDIGTGANGWGNNELQYYTNRPENVSTDGNGNLVITAKRETFGTSQFTSARIKTKNIFSQTYGRFEARLITPYGQGIWPAFWMLGSNIDTAPWPNCGEIDIMELRGQLPSTVNGALIGPGYSTVDTYFTSSYSLQYSRFDVDYHVFAVEWDADKIDYFVDGYLYKRVDKNDVTREREWINGAWVYDEWVFDNDFFMLLNVAVGGNFLGNPNDTTSFPQKMTIDYVRVYTEGN